MAHRIGSFSDSTFSMASGCIGANLGSEDLLQLSDSVRRSLSETRSFGPSAQVLSAFLEKMTYNEIRGLPMIDFETIKHARLDKLMDDIIALVSRPTALPPGLVEDIIAASTLQRLWRARFKARYFMIDDLRARELTTCGRLKDVLFTPPDRVDDPRLNPWKAKAADPISGLECDLRFNAGQ